MATERDAAVYSCGVTFFAAGAADVAAELGAAMGRMQPIWLLGALILHVVGQLCRGLAWHEVLRSSWPVTRRRVCAWHVCGAGLSGVLSARGADLVRIGLARREVPGASCAGLAGSLVAEGSFAAASGAVLTVVALAIGVGAVATPPVASVALAGAVAAVVALLAWRSAQAISPEPVDLGNSPAFPEDPERRALFRCASALMKSRAHGTSTTLP